MGDAGWRRRSADEVGERISVAVQMMHTSGPARVMTAEELADVDWPSFELDPPQVVADAL